MIKKMKLRLKLSDDISIFHDSRSDMRLMAKFCNSLADKVEELVDEVNQLKEENKELRSREE